ncbi:MAG: transglutaminase-like domain-containing protein [Christensenellaceae bacterium]|jgi:transglutaminase-like putative cysteine protease|nr:transglutaminase-like domain-containing protein [Christensenellaceae bacterium]
MRGRQKSHGERDRWPDLCFDLLSAILLCLPLSHALVTFLAFDEITQGLSALLSALTAGLVFLLSRRWWLAPGLIGLLGLALGAALYFDREIGSISAYFIGFCAWALDGCPKAEPYSYDQSLLLIKALLCLPVAALSLSFFRRFFSLSALALLCAAFPVFLFYTQSASVELALAALFSALILSLPRLVGRQIQKSGHGRIPRWLLQLWGLPAAALCVGLAFYLVPSGEIVWRNAAVSSFFTDVNDAVDYYTGVSKRPGPQPGLQRYGFMPLGSRLGGDVELGSEKLFDLRGERPPYLRLSAYNQYDGAAWSDDPAFKAGNFRLASPFWRRERREAFGGYLPGGGREASQAYSLISRPVQLRVSPWLGGARGYFTAGNSLSLSQRDLPYEPYFNLQGELYDGQGRPIARNYEINFIYLDRSLPGFAQNMALLERLGAGKDPCWAQIQAEYLGLYEGLPPEVPELAAELTAGLASPYEKARAIERYLGSPAFAYTLTPGSPAEGQDFVLQFLKAKKGYCSYFASAMAVLARCAGLPARYVTGFGAKSSSGSDPLAYAAYEFSAHAWCEIYFEGVGWLVFDPVAWDYALPEEKPEGGPAPGLPRPTPEPEPSPEPEPDEGARPDEAERAEEAAGAFYLWVLLIPLMLGLLALIYRLLMRRRFFFYRAAFARRRWDDEGCLRLYWEDFLRQARFWHVELEPGETLLAFTERCARYLQPEGAIREMGLRLSAHVYGQKPLQPGDLAFFAGLHEQIENALLLQLGHFRYFFLRALG